MRVAADVRRLPAIKPKVRASKPPLLDGTLRFDYTPATVSDYILRYAPPDEVVRLAQENGFTTIEIVRIVSGALPHRDAQKVAETYAPLLHLTVAEFMKLRKNELS